MNGPAIAYKESRELDREQVVALYRSNRWSAADWPDELCRALTNSHSLVTAWDGERLVGLGNAISDGFLVVYYPHLLVAPDYQRQGIGAQIMAILMSKYADFHQQMLVAESSAVEFYHRCGFQRAGATVPMWIFAGDEH